jgi:hypothetical protein
MLLQATFYIDGTPVLIDGEFTEESGLRGGASSSE